MTLPAGAGAVLSPHADDAVLSAWSALRAPGDVRVVTVFAAVPPDGTLGWFDPVFGVDDSAALMRRRLDEDAAALAIAGRTAVRLDLLDEQYRDGPLARETVERALEPCVDGVEWMLAPAGIGAHPDHVIVRDAAHAIAQRRSLALLLYADLPYAVRWGWPSWVSGAPERPFLVPDALWAGDVDGFSTEFAALRPEALSLSAGEIERKSRAIECYASQYWALNAGPLDRLRHPEIIGHELRWLVPPPS